MDEKGTQTEDAQPCCVCGEKTKRRCGACEQHGFNLFFCSREHQKLIWPTHKRFCGPNSSIIDSLTKGAEHHPVDSDLLLLTVRAFRWARLEQDGQPSYDPVECTSRFEFETARLLTTTSEITDHPFCPALRHACLAIFAISQHLHSASSPPAGLKTLGRKARGRFIHFLQNDFKGLAGDDAAEAAGAATFFLFPRSRMLWPSPAWLETDEPLVDAEPA
ncbi:hypothetical protein JCM6882_007561 [Rhodosporidiobolus microsporus]